MNSKQIGNIGEARVLAEFVKHKIPVFIPFGDNERADLVAEINGSLCKIQVKTAAYTNDGKATFSLTSSTEHRKNGIKRRYTKDEIDYFALYSLERDKVYLVKAPDEPKSAITIRFLHTKNSQQAGIKYEEDYLFEHVIKDLQQNKTGREF